MSSVTASEKAANWQDLFAEEIDREQEDKENLEFFDEREKVSRMQTRAARLEIRALQAEVDEWSAICDRTETLERLDLDYWTDDDVAFCKKIRGNSCYTSLASRSHLLCSVPYNPF